MPCSAIGQPSPHIEWNKLLMADEQNGQSVSLGPELRFNSISQQDSGVYECRASNGGVEKDLVSRVRVNVLGK